MDPKRKQELETAALERNLKNAEEVLRKGFLKFVTPRVLLFTVIFTPLFGLVQMVGSKGNSLDDWLWYLLAGFCTGLIGATAEYFIWRWSRNRNARLIRQKKGSGSIPG